MATVLFAPRAVRKVCAQSLRAEGGSALQLGAPDSKRSLYTGAPRRLDFGLRMASYML